MEVEALLGSAVDEVSGTPSRHQSQIASWLVVGIASNFSSQCYNSVWYEPVQVLCLLSESL